MLGLHLNPVLIKEYSDQFELLVVEIAVNNVKMRVMSGYGPQENWDEKQKLPFFEALESEIASAELEARSVIICMDANSKLGPNYILGDPHGQSGNGKLLADILDRHALIVLNGVQEKCTGLYTREKRTVIGIEQSVIDFVIVSSNLMKHVQSIHIDGKRLNVLTRLTKRGNHKKIVESDHNMIETKLNISWQSYTDKPLEVFNFSNKESQNKFFKATHDTKAFTDIFETNKSLAVQTKKFIKRLNGFIHEAFKKVKIVVKGDSMLERLYEKRRQLRNKSDDASKEELEIVEEELATKYSESMYNKIKNELKAVKGDEGGYNPGHLWKLKKKLSPKQSEPPSSMKDSEGNLLTNLKDIKAEAVKHYKRVFEDKPIDTKYKDHQVQREELCQQRLEAAAQNKTPPWTNLDVKTAIKGLHMGISKDPYGHPNEIFKEGIAGQGLLNAITILMNKIKDNPKEYPVSMTIYNVTNIYKNKGDKNSFDSHRGVFRTTSLRNIMDKLIYIDEYKTVDSNLTNCNVGSRKNRNIRDNLFVMNAIMNNSKRGNGEPCDICVYDIRKCFDSLWMHECINDLYENGLTNDKLCMIYYSNINASIAIKSSSGMSERFNIHNKVMQGTVWSGLMCTCTIDSLSKISYTDHSLLYKYKNTVNVPPLQMVDDVITASKCGNQVVKTNSLVNTFVKLKKLELSGSKCSRIHVGKSKCKYCPKISVNKEPIKDSEKEKYLGDYLTSLANPKATILDRKTKGYGILSEMSAILQDIPLGVKRYEIGLTLRQAWFLNGTLFNSEAWCAYSNSDLEVLKVLDRKIARLIFGAHSRAHNKMQYILKQE